MMLISVLPSIAQAQIQIKGLPQKLSWIEKPLNFKQTDSGFRMTGGEKTDLFVDPLEAYNVVNSPKLVFDPDETFLLSTKVNVAFASDYDAAVLVLYRHEKSWAKFCFELSPAKIPTVVSVVNNGAYSDDCNHQEFREQHEIYLRIAGLGKNIFALHYSTDGKYWNLVRYFSLDKDATGKPISVGFSSQSPTGKSCESVFTEINYEVKKLSDIRNGE
jgi:regulation of enolase protein 1 (concanavalin A-like superfamily)